MSPSAETQHPRVGYLYAFGLLLAVALTIYVFAFAS